MTPAAGGWAAVGAVLAYDAWLAETGRQTMTRCARRLLARYPALRFVVAGSLAALAVDLLGGE